MRVMTGEEWAVAAQLYAFLGNSLLVPMSRTESVGLDAAFWRDLSGMCNGALAAPTEALAVWAERAAMSFEHSDLVQRVSVEFTKLFVGPPKPAAAPWESANGAVASHVGFGEATFAMRERLRALGLEVCNQNNQYEDHLGIELLYLSELCRRVGGAGDARENAGFADGVAAGDFSAGSPAEHSGVDAAFVERFVREHPLAWIGRFRAKVQAACPDGYYVRLLDVAIALLKWQVQEA